MDFTTLSGEALTEALSLDFATLDNDGLAAALTERRTAATALFALDSPTVAQVDDAEALVASIAAVEAAQAERDKVAEEAAKRFAAARQSFSADAGTEDADADDAEDADAEDGDDAEDADADDAEDGDDAEETADEGEAAVTASAVDHSKGQTIKTAKTSTAKAVARRNKRPAVKAAQPVVITASADVPEFSNGQVLTTMDQVAKGVENRVAGFSPFNEAAAHAEFERSGGQPVLRKFGVASFGLQFEDGHKATKGNEYGPYRQSIEDHKKALVASVTAAAKGEVLTLTAAGWCSPSETVYSFIADYVVDGLVTVPEVSAPRGGINITTGPARSSQGAALEDFGFHQTEAQAEAGTVKTCETIVCPDFTDHRLDAFGYCYKIPILTNAAYPELVTDALRFADVLYAHKLNEFVISEMVSLSDAVDFSGYGPSFTDSLEALSLLATKERRKWNIGENAIMEVKIPVWAKEVFRADMSRRTGLALTDVANDQKIAAEFATRRLAVEYVADWQELEGDDIVLPGSFDVMVYPAGTFIKPVKPVINLSAVYDAASLSVNEYTGVFFEQGLTVVKAGYASSILTIGVNTAGETGAAILQGLGDASAAGSF